MLQVVEQWQVSIYHNKDQICKRSRGQSWGGVYVCLDLGAYGVIGHKALVLNRSPLQNFLSYYSIISRWINTRYITRYAVFDLSLSRSLLYSVQQFI